MKTGFSFKGIHSDRFGITLKTDNRPIVPAVKTKTASAAYMDGEYDFSAANPYGRMMYENRAFTVMLQICADDLSELNLKVSKIAAWLTGSGQLIFDDTDTVYWAATVYKEIAYAPELRGKKALLTAEFTVSPFARLLFDSTDGAAIGDSIKLGSNIPLDPTQYFTHTCTVSGSSYTDYEYTFTVPNMGQRPIRPTVTLDYPENVRIIDTLTVSHGDNKIEVDSVRTSSSGGNIAIDFERQEVIYNQNDGGSSMATVTGEFFELSGTAPEITLAFNGSVYDGTTADITVSISYTPQYLWDADFDDIDWGDDE